MKCGICDGKITGKKGMHAKTGKQRYQCENGHKTTKPVIETTHEAPDGFHVKGVSTLYDADGRLRAQWIKTSKNAEKMVEAITAMIEGMTADLPRAKPKSVPKSVQPIDELLTVYPLGDPHIGMYAWADETGDDFDCDIAERDLVAGIDRAVETAPASREALILNLGDFFHADTLDNMTRRSGNVLDVDTRWPRVLQIGVRALRRCVDRALGRHETVHVKNLIGNHDDHTSYALTLIADAVYENEPRVIVDKSPSQFWYKRFGRVLIGATHGHNTKPADLPEIMAADCPADWGATEYRYWYTGHVHHKNLQEFRGCVWESFRTLAASDAWHAGKGYRSGRDLIRIVLHREFGEVERSTFNLKLIRAGA